MAKRNSGEPLKEEEKRQLNSQNFKQLLGIFRFTIPYRGLFIVGLVALVLSSGTLLAFPLLAGKLLDIATGKKIPYFSSINEIALALVVILFVQSIFSFVRVYTFAIVSERALADLRKTLYQKIIWLPLSFFDNRRVGELMSRITADVAILMDLFSLTVAEFLRQILTLILGTANYLFFRAKANRIHAAHFSDPGSTCAGIWKIHSKTVQENAGSTRTGKCCSGRVIAVCFGSQSVHE